MTYDWQKKSIWTSSHGAAVNDLIVDSSDNVITAGVRVGGYTTRKYDSDGNLLWSKDLGGNAYAVAVDSSDNIIVVGDPASSTDPSVIKYDSDGNILWTAIHGELLFCVSVDSSGNVYVGGYAAADTNTVRKFNSSGDLLWSAATTLGVIGIDTDSNGRVVCGTAWSYPNDSIFIFDSSGTLVDSINNGRLNRTILVDSFDNIYSGGGGGIKKYNSSGSLLWSSSFSGVVYHLRFDHDGGILSASTRLTYTTRKHDILGNVVWQIDRGGNVFGIGVLSNGHYVECGVLFNSMTTEAYSLFPVFCVKYPQTGISKRVFPGKTFGLAPWMRDLYVMCLLKRGRPSTTFFASLPGVSSVYNNQIASLPGVSSVYNNQIASLPGVSSVMLPITADLPGVSSVMAFLSHSLPGVSSVYRTFADNSLPGVSSVLMQSVASLPGVSRVANDADDRYELFIGIDAEPDLSDTAEPHETFTSLPHDVALTPPASGEDPITYHLVTRKRNQWGLSSLNNLVTRITIDDAGTIQPTSPRSPREVAITEVASLKAQITAVYDYPADGTDQADTWLLYITTDGSAPDPTPGGDTPIEVAMVKTEATTSLTYTTAELSLSTVVKALVRVRRSVTPDVDSTNTAIVTLTIEGSGLTAVTQTESIMGTLAQVQPEPNA